VECLNIFSQGAKKQEVVALKLVAKEAEERAARVITLWEMELEMLEDWLNNLGLAREWAEFELSEKRMIEQQVSQEETVELKSAAEWKIEATDEDEEGSMGDHGDLPNGQNFLQLRRLHEDQPLEQLDEVIIEIRELMLKSADTASREQLSRKKEATVVVA
jgi:hypothetical protein